MDRQRGLTLLHLILGIVLIFGGLIGMKACENHNASLKATAQAAKSAADKAKLITACQHTSQPVNCGVRIGAPHAFYQC